VAPISFITVAIRIKEAIEAIRNKLVPLPALTVASFISDHQDLSIHSFEHSPGRCVINVRTNMDSIRYGKDFATLVETKRYSGALMRLGVVSFEDRW